MPVTIPQTETILKSYFQTGDQPTQDQFEELIGTMFHLFQTAQDAADAATADAADALSRAPNALVKATTNGVSAYTIEAGEINVASIVVTNPLSASEIIKVTWDTPFGNDDYKVLVSTYSGVVPYKNNVQIVSQTTDYVELRFSRENPSFSADYGLPSFHLCVFL